jgi:hypothetical protein
MRQERRYEAMMANTKIKGLKISINIEVKKSGFPQNEMEFQGKV